MEIIYAREKIPTTIRKSIFLAGPSSRTAEITQWRLEVLKILADIGFTGTIFVPENTNIDNFQYQEQIEWEDQCLNIADCILFWIPRTDLLPGFTTNIEWGTWCKSNKVILGYPKSAAKMEYVNHYARKYRIPIGKNLISTVNLAIEFLGVDEIRTGGEIYVPSMIWRLDSFKSWYATLKKAGNRLDHAQLLYNYQCHKNVFLWILKVAIYIQKEYRHKNEEFVLARPDICSVVMYYPDGINTQIVLVKEFRSPSRTCDGFIRELPGGSSWKTQNKQKVIMEEVHEETGFDIDANRLIYHGERQLMGTLSSHTCSLYGLKLTQQELDYFHSQRDVMHGIVEQSEQTYVEIYTLNQLFANPITDWATLGQIFIVTQT